MPFSFTTAAPEIPLANAPLLRALCQIRYTPVPELVDDETERLLAHAFQSTYPVRGSVEGISIPMLPGVQSVTPQRFRTFEDAPGDWKVTVAPDFLALETAAYTSRTDLVERVGAVVASLAAAQTPPRVTRIGVRYIDRVESPDDLRDLVRPSLQGWLVDIEDDRLMQHQTIQTLLVDPDSQVSVLVRSLFLPSNAMFDPTVPPVQQPSWVLDIDSYREAATAFEPVRLTETVRVLAERAYRVFHWAVTDALRERYGREV